MTMEALMADWHRHELGADFGLGSPRLLMGCPLWNKGYVDHFLDYCWPSLLANRLDGCALVLFVDGETEQRLAGLPIAVRRLPDALASHLNTEGNYKYHLLAAAHNLLIHKAGEAGAGFSMMVADMIYSEHYFENLLRLAEHHDAIAHTGFAITSATGCPALDHYRHGDTLRISALDLGAISWKHLNSEWVSWTMDGITDFTEMPNAHLIHWRARDHIRIHSAHQNAAWISSERCKRAGTGVGGTIDSELPRYMGGEFYQPTLLDNMACISIAGTTVPTPRIGFDVYRKEFWRFIGNDERFLPYFTRPVVVPAPYDYDAPSDVEIDERFARLMALLEEGRS